MIGKKIKQPAGYKAFIPNVFPGSLQVNMNDSKLNELHYWAGHYLAKLDGITQLLPDLDFFIFMYVRKEAAYSSQIEGTQATMSDAIRAEAKLTAGLPKDVVEVQNYINAMSYGLKRLEDFPLSLRLVREIHGILLSEPSDQINTPGEFRKSQNWIGGTSPVSAIFVPPPVEEMLRSLNDLEKFLHANDSFLPLVKTGLMHAQFETIHPFLDGNGRTGRLLITFYLNKIQVLEKPVLYLSAFFKKHRKTYFEKINDYHEKGDVESWLKFFLEGVCEVSKDAIRVSREINELRVRDEEKVSHLGQTTSVGMKVLKNLFRLPIIDINSMVEWTGYTPRGAYNILDKFVTLGILQQKDQDQEYARQFIYSEYLNLFSKEV